MWRRHLETLSETNLWAFACYNHGQIVLYLLLFCNENYCQIVPYSNFPFLFAVVILVESPSVVDQWHFVTDLDPQIHNSVLWIWIRIQLQIRILFSSVAFQIQGYFCLLLSSGFRIRIRIRIESVFNRASGSGSGSRRAKTTHKSRKIVFFKVLLHQSSLHR